MKFQGKILTIILLTHNRSKYLKESLSAILSQSYTDFELLVVDNHSIDDTASLMIEYNDPRLQYIRLGPNGSPTCGQTFAIKFVESKYVLITHDDDIMKVDMVEKQVNFLEKNKNILALSTNVSLVNEEGLQIQKKLYDFESDIVFNKIEYIEEYLKSKFWLPTPTTIFKTDIYKQIKNTFTPMPSSDVLELFLMNLEGPIAILSEPLLRYRQHDNQESRNVNQSEPHIQLFSEIIKFVKNNKDTHYLLPKLYATYAKYKMQHILFCYDIKLLSKVRNDLINMVPEDDRLIDEFYILEILFIEFGFDGILNKEQFVKACINDKNKMSSMHSNYRQWLSSIYNKQSIWRKYDKLKNIAILGSMLTSFMLVKDALNNNIKVINCLDSSRQRVGNNVLGVEIIPLDDINKIENDVDAIILSSEREHENALKNIISNKLINKDLLIISWKEMVGSV